MRISITFLAVATLTLAAPAADPSSGPAPRVNSIVEIATPAAPDSQCSNIIAGPDGTLHLTWCAPGDRPGERAMRLASLAPGAIAWSAPRTVVSTPLLLENWADFASLVVGTDGALIAQWFQQASAEARGYDGWFARSTDGGATWSKPAPLGHEFVALAPLSGGRTLAIWLASARPPRDPAAPAAKRDPATPRPARKAGDPYTPAMFLQSRLLAPDGSTLGEWVVDADVCTCCQNTVTVLPGDRVFAGYRGHTADEIRDNKYALFDLATRTWTAPASLKEDGWKIAACPVNGPAADSRGATVAVAWFTAAEGIAKVQARISPDAARTFSAPTRLDLGRPMGRIETVMLADSSALVLWMEAKSGDVEAGIHARRLWPDGTLSAARLVADSTQARASGFPRAALRPNGRVVMSWTQPGEPGRVRTGEIDPAPFVRAAAGTVSIPSRRGVPIELELCVAPLALAGH